MIHDTRSYAVGIWLTGQLECPMVSMVCRHQVFPHGWEYCQIKPAKVGWIPGRGLVSQRWDGLRTLSAMSMKATRHQMAVHARVCTCMPISKKTTVKKARWSKQLQTELSVL